MDKNELLKVLDMPKDEQIGRLVAGDFLGYEAQCHLASRRISLADLAFQLRDEACKDALACDNYRKALHIVYQSFRYSQLGTVRQNMVSYELWLESFITPIERIIAALIAKEEASPAE